MSKKNSNTGNLAIAVETISPAVFCRNGFEKSEKGYIIRISDLIWCEINEYGFAELRRKRENANKQKSYDKIIIPNPIRNEEGLKTLLLALNGNGLNKNLAGQ